MELIDMTEIKSTIDLVMEKTKNMVQSDEEIAEAAAEERAKKAKGYALALVEERMKPEELPDRLEEDSYRDHEELEKATIEAIIDEIGFDRHPEQLLAGLETLVGDRLAPETAQVRDAWNECNQKMRETAAASSGRVLQELAAKGITGSALQAKEGEGSAPEEGEAAEGPSPEELEARLEEIKRSMKEKV
jgi:SOS response regulatory protein OraA/RecX